jgi:hypothetical protein
METKFTQMLKDKHPDIDINRAIELFDETLSEVQLGTLEENTEMRLPLGCDLNKHIFIRTLNKYIENGKTV